MSPLFHSPIRRIARAKKHIEDLELEIRDFLDSKPYARVVEPHTDGVNQAHKIKLTHSIPDAAINDAIGAAEALRSALDQAGSAAAVASGKTKPKNTYFPIADSLAELDTSVIGRGRCKDLPPDILTLFRSFQPYKGGNDLVWALNQVANGTKHRLLVPIGMGVGGGNLKRFETPGMIVRFEFPPRWDTSKDEIILAIIGPQTHVEYDMQLAFQVTFGPIETIAGKLAVPVLSGMASEVERIVLATEAETRRIGLIA